MPDQNNCSQICGFFTILVIVFFIAPIIWIYQKLATIANVIFQAITALTVLMIFVPIVLYISFWVIIYRIFIYCIVRLYHGSKFDRMLSGADRICTMEVTSPHVILFLIKYKEPVDFYKKMSQTIGKILKKNYQDNKLFSTTSSFLGYSYLVKNEIPFTEYVKPLPSIAGNELNQHDLLKSIEEQGPLPNNNKGLWEVSIGTQEIFWITVSTKTKVYPIVLRFHPCVSNILHIINNILTAPHLEEGQKNKARLNINTKSILEKLKNCIQSICYLFKVPCVFLKSFLKMHPKDKIGVNPLYGPTLSHRKTFCILDYNSAHNIELIKAIKEKFPGSIFRDILLTAFTASLDDYYTKVLGKAPASKPHFILSENYASTRPVENINEDSNYRSSTMILKLLISSSSRVTEVDVINNLHNIVKERTKKEIHSIENKVHYKILKIFLTYLPSPVLKLFIKKYKCTAIINNLPGPIDVRAIGGTAISNMYVWTPHHGNTGISLTIGSYDGKMQFALSADKALIPEREDVQQIVDSIFNYLTMMVNI